MWGFNWIDAIILVLLVLAAIEGARLGLLTQAFAIAGFFGTLFLAGWLFPHILNIRDSTLLATINAGLVLLSASCAGLLGLGQGQNMHWSFRLGKHSGRRRLKKIESWLGGVFAVAATLVLFWLLGVGFGRLPFEGFSNSVSDSKVVQALTRALPPVPAVFAEFDKQINPNSPPFVTAQPKPYSGFEYSPADVQSASAKGAASIARITSFGCGGLVSGSGFVIAPNLVATDAHVIAGVKRPIVKLNGSSHEGVPVFFDAGLDLAILRTKNLKATALPLAASDAQPGTTVAVAGFPGGNYSAAPGIIRDSLKVTSTNIYYVGSFERSAYGVQTRVEDGSSGGPVILPNGKVTGIVFSQSTTIPDYAYALASSYLKQALSQSLNSYQRVSTGACTTI